MLVFFKCSVLIILVLLYPCMHAHIDEFLQRKLQTITSSVNVRELLIKTFGRIHKKKQKNVTLLMDKVKIKPTVHWHSQEESSMEWLGTNPTQKLLPCIAS